MCSTTSWTWNRTASTLIKNTAPSPPEHLPIKGGLSPGRGSAPHHHPAYPSGFARLIGIIALIYFGINLAYSIWLKHIPLIDVLIIAACYVLRVAAGVVLITVQRFSPWLYIVTTLFALFIGFGKRRAELSLLEGEAKSHRRVLDGYNIPLLDQLITIVSGTTVVAYSLYTFTAPNVPPNHAMMLTIPFILYGIFRYLWLISVKHAGGAPEELVFTDRPLQVTILLWGFSVLVIFYTS